MPWICSPRIMFFFNVIGLSLSIVSTSSVPRPLKAQNKAPCTQFALSGQFSSDMPVQFSPFNGGYVLPYDGFLIVKQLKVQDVVLPVTTWQEAVAIWTAPSIFCLPSGCNSGPLTMPIQVADHKYGFDIVSFDLFAGMDPLTYRRAPVPLPNYEVTWKASGVDEISYAVKTTKFDWQVAIYACPQQELPFVEGKPAPILLDEDILYLRFSPDYGYLIGDRCVKVWKFLRTTPPPAGEPNPIDLPASWNSNF